MTLYLDNAATSFPKPEAVYTAMDRVARTSAANPGRAGHRMALASQRVLDVLRQSLAELFGAPDPNRVVLTLNATDALNMAIKGLLREGDHVLTTVLEHNSVSRPLRALEQAGTIAVDRLQADGQGFVDPDDLARHLKPNTKLVVVTHASNVLGSIQPADAIGRWARQQGLVFLRMREAGEHHAGPATFDAWAQLLADPTLSADGAATKSRRRGILDPMIWDLATRRHYGALFLKRAAELYPPAATHLEAAAACFRAEHDMMWKVNSVAGGKWPGGDLPKLGDPTIRKQIAAVLLEARGNDLEAADHIERALGTMGAGE